jgi:hypothetical protein
VSKPLRRAKTVTADTTQSQKTSFEFSAVVQHKILFFQYDAATHGNMMLTF